MGIRLEDHEESEGCDKVDHNIEDMLIYKNEKNRSSVKAQLKNNDEKENFAMNHLRT